MGRAINMENELDKLKVENTGLDKRLKLVEDALEELVQTRVHHVDLTELEEELDDERNVKAEGVEVKPDKVSKSKKTTKLRDAAVV